jgi:hypothetical protein
MGNPFDDIIPDEPKKKSNPFDDLIPEEAKSLTIPSQEEVPAPTVTQEKPFLEKAKELLPSGEQMKTILRRSAFPFVNVPTLPGEQRDVLKEPDPITMTLATQIPASLGVSIPAKLATGGAINTGLGALDRLISQHRLPTSTEAGIDFGLGLIPGAIGAYSKYIGKATGKSVTDVLKQAKTIAGETHEPLETVVQKMVSEIPPEFTAPTKPLETALGREAGKIAEISTTDVTPESLLSPVREGAVRFRKTATGETPLVGRTFNLNRIDSTEQYKNFLTNFVDQIPEAQLPKETFTFAQLEKRAAQEFGLSPKQFMKNLGGTGNLIRGDIRRNTIRAAAAMDAADMKGQAFHQMTKQLDEAIKSGQFTEEMEAKWLEDMVETAFVVKEAGGIRSEFGRGLNALKRLSKGEKARQRIINTVGETLKSKGITSQEAISKLAELDPNDPKQVFMFLRGLTEHSTRDKIYEAWINGLLSGPKTHIVNSTSNALVTVWREAERPVAATVDLFRARMTGTPRERFFGEAVHGGFGAWQGLKEGFRIAGRAFKDELPEDAITKLDIPERFYGGAIKGRAGKIVRLPSRFLIAADEFFKSIGRTSERYALAFRQASIEGLEGQAKAERIADLIANPTEEIQEKALQESLYRTFQKPLGPFGQKFLNLRQHGGLSVIFPFVRTPINIAKFGLERTPLNLAKAMGEGLSGSLRGGQFADEVAKGLLGTAIGAGIVMAAREGMITGGGPTNDEEKRVLYATGWKPYSFKVGNQYIGYGRLEPLGVILGLAADTADLWDIAEPSDAVRIIGESIGKNLTSKTWLLALEQVTDALSDPERNFWKLARGLTGSIVPTGIAQLSQAFDPRMKDPQNIQEVLMSRIPGFSLEVEPLRDIWGKPILSQETGPERFLSPFRRGEVVQDDATNEVRRLGITAYMGTPRDVIGDIKLTREQYQNYVATSGALAHERVTALISSPFYENLPDEKKASLIENIFRKAREQVRNEIKRGIITGTTNPKTIYISQE